MKITSIDRELLSGTVDMSALVDALDPERHEPEIAYEFSNGRRFYRSPDPYAWAKE